MKMISNNSPEKRIAGFIERIRSILNGTRYQALVAVNNHMVVAYWNIGREIVEEEQKGKVRANYGDRLIESLSEKLSGEFGSSISKNNLWYMRQFYLTYPPQTLRGKLHAVRGESSTERGTNILHALRGELTWTHYRLLLSVESRPARDFYEMEAVKARWSTRELERQIASQLYERLRMSRDKKGVLRLSKKGHEPTKPADLIKDPYVLEFTGLPERELLRENDLESALIDQMKNFLLELGRGFSFVARQKRITLDGDHHWIDLVFYHIPLRRYVLIELKTGKLTHQDIGQLQMYVNYYDRELRESGTDKTIGILLCARKNDAIVKFTLPKNNRQIFASKYQLYFPTRKELAIELERERKTAESKMKDMIN